MSGYRVQIAAELHADGVLIAREAYSSTFTVPSLDQVVARVVEQVPAKLGLSGFHTATLREGESGAWIAQGFNGYPVRISAIEAAA